MYVNILYVRMCEPISFWHNLLRWCSILVLIRFHGYFGLRPTGIPQRFPPKCHLTVFNLCYPPWPSWCMCPVGRGLASGSRFSISSIVCPSALYVAIAFWYLKLYVKENIFSHAWFLQPSKERTVERDTSLWLWNIYWLPFCLLSHG